MNVELPTEVLDLPEIYETAALLLEGGHWQQHRLGTPSECMCAAGALLVASGAASYSFDCFIEDFDPGRYDDAFPVLSPLANEVRRRLVAPCHADVAYMLIWSWNDLLAQTEENVIRVLREVAARLREEQDK